MLTKEHSVRKAFETWVKRSWHKSYWAALKRNENGIYTNFDLQQAWFAYSAAWRRSRRK